MDRNSIRVYLSGRLIEFYFNFHVTLETLFFREPVDVTSKKEVCSLLIDSFYNLTKVLVSPVVARRAATSLYTSQFKMVTVYKLAPPFSLSYRTTLSLRKPKRGLLNRVL